MILSDNKMMWRAHIEMRSLLSEGYRYIGKIEKAEKVQYFFLHPANHNRCTVIVYHAYIEIYINRDLRNVISLH